MKYTKYCFLLKLIIEHSCLVILFVISIAVIFLCIFKPIYVEWNTSQIDSINDAMLSIATGYVSGYIIYYLSVLLPKASRMTPVLNILTENIRYARDEISAFFVNHGGPAEIDKQTVIELITFFSLKKEHDMYFIETDICDRLHGHVMKAIEYLQFVISQADYLDDHDIENIKTIIKSENSLESRLRDRIETIKEIELMSSNQNIKNEIRNNCQLYHKNEVIKIVEDIQKIYTVLNNLHKKYE